MNKKGNTILFIIIATIMNILLMIIFAVIGYVLIIKFANPESPVTPVLLIVVLFGSMALAWYLYSKIIKLLQKKWNLDDKLVPLWGKNAHKRNRDEE